MNPTQRALLQTILENPTANEPRLVYADWLEENGNEADLVRAEFIRVQLEQETLPSDDPRQIELAKREKQLRNRPIPDSHPEAKRRTRKRLLTYHEVWQTELGVESFNPEYRRGFLGHLRLGALDWLERGHHIREHTPIESLHLERYQECLNDIANAPIMDRILHLRFDDYNESLGPEGVIVLANSTFLFRLQTLDLMGHSVGGSGLKTILSSPTLARLTALDLGVGDLEDADVIQLAQSPFLAQLNDLRLSHNYALRQDALIALSNSPQIAQLRKLDLSYNEEIEAAGWLALAESPYLNNLTFLDVYGACARQSDEGEALQRRFGKENVRFALPNG